MSKDIAEEVRSYYRGSSVSRGDEFDRWLAEVKAQAWEEGNLAEDIGPSMRASNPYREAMHAQGAKQVSDHQGKVSFTPSSIIYCCSEHMAQATNGVNNGTTA